MDGLALILTVTAILVTYVSCQGNNQQCPKPDIIEPCQCRQECPTCIPVIRCHRILGLKNLEEIFTHSGNYPFTTLELTELVTSYIPSIDIKQVKQLYLVNSTVNVVFEHSPSETSPLEVISLNKVKLLRGISAIQFSKLYSLRQLYITDTAARKIGEDFGDRLPKGLQVLQFVGTRTRVVEGKAFASLGNLLYFTIRNTGISKVGREMLPTPFKGVFLDFSENKLSSLPNDFFTDMPQLHTLLLSRNEFSVFSESSFGNLPARLRVIFLRGNPIKCDCNMHWIIEKKMPYLEGQCTGPRGLEDKRIRDLRETDFIQC